MVGDAGQPLDHGGDALKGPVVGVQAVGAGALAQRLVQVVALLVERRGAGPVGPRLASACSPPACQRACQRLTFWRATPSWWATSAWVWPAANSAPACRRTPSKAWRSRGPRALRR